MSLLLPLLAAAIAGIVASETLFRPPEPPPTPAEPDLAPGQGIVVCVDRERPGVDGKAWLELTVRVARRPMPSYLAVAEVEVEREHRIRPGDRVGLEVDPENPVRVRISSLPPPA